MTKTCTQCGTEFDAGKRPLGSLTCSVDCSLARHRAARAEYKAKQAAGLGKPEYRAAQAERKRKRYQSDPEYRAAQAERQRKRYQSDPEYRAAVAERDRKRRKRRQDDPEFRATKAEYHRKRYQNDPEFRAARSEYNHEYNRERKAETVSRMLAMLNSGELAAYGTEPYFLYRFYDEGGALLYVGITNDPERRLYEHAAEKPWAGDIARTEYAVYANKTEAAAAEAALIKELGPLHNVVHNSVIKIPLTANETRC